MNEPTPARKAVVYSLLPTDIEGFESLAELALNLRWSWNHATDQLWRQMDPHTWELTHNPWVVLQTVSRERIERRLADPIFRTEIEGLAQSRREALEAPAWFQQEHAEDGPNCIAYFSMEFMLSEALPIYSGGLGNVAGDQLKTASDLGVPVIGVGLLYQQGYFRQMIDLNGAQQAFFPYNDPGQLPVFPLRHANGDWLRLRIALPGYSLWLRAWQVNVGRVRLLLLDTNDAGNFPAHRGITSELYGGGPELRLMQELVLGIGGWQLLEALGLRPEVCHLNEGHAAFAVLERARSYMRDSGQPFDISLAITRAGNLFTTHTAVAAGFDRFPPAMLERYLGGYAEQQLGIKVHELLALGRANPNDPAESFNMAYLAIRGSGAVNGVSRLHGQVSRRLFEPLFPQWPQDEIPVAHVTNGVHVPTWDSALADDLWTEVCGKARWLGSTRSLEQSILGASDARLWQFRAEARKSLVEFARKRLAQELESSGAAAEAVEAARHVFDPEALTLGFARRFAAYKRPTLLLHDQARLERLLTNASRPVQLIIAGKAHPADQAGQDMIQHWVRFIRRPEMRAHAIFLGDYDMHVTEHLVQGVDVWINTPRRPWEACGTSGMKVLVNGGINLSKLDGWWAEAYAPELGWALADIDESGDEAARDAADAKALYDLLEHAVIPEFYARDANGISATWTQCIRQSMARLTPQFSANRAVREYTENYYLPAVAAYRSRSADRGAAGRQLIERQRQVEQHWHALRFGALSVETIGALHLFKVELYLDELDPDSVRVELYAEPLPGTGPLRQQMMRIGPLPGTAGGYLYGANVSAERPPGHYSARATPRCDGLATPLENARILWQR
jgi:starch phosphorylase